MIQMTILCYDDAMAFERLSSDVLRQHKGVSFTGITTVFFCHDGNGKLLLAKRSKNARDEHGTWEPGGGGLKHGQSVEENMKRELKEEYGVEPIRTEYLGYFDAFRETPDGQPTHWVAMCFAVHVDPAQIQIGEPDMIEAHAWFDLDDLPQPLHSQFNKFMELYGDKLRRSMLL